MTKEQIIQLIQDTYELEGLGCTMRRKDAIAIVDALIENDLLRGIDD